MYTFADRHIGLTQNHAEAMLNAIGVETIEELVAQAIPDHIRWHDSLDLPEAVTEAEVLTLLREAASHNILGANFIGQGYYGTHVPTVIARNVLENPAWYTSYTPYQPEISQGRLEALLNFQTLITDMTGLDIAGASLLDEATAVAEAITLMMRSHKSGNTVLLDADLHPQSLAVAKTRCTPLNISIRLVDDWTNTDWTDVFGTVIAQVGTSGAVRSISDIAAIAHSHGALVAAATDLLALTLIEAPGNCGADIVVGSAQRYGVPMAMGGPHAGFMAVRQGLERSLPGRLVGVSVDSHGNPAYRLALQTREQHIRREKATSNICTAQALLAICSAMYASYHGWDGLTSIALGANKFARRFGAAVEFAGKTVVSRDVFDTVTWHENEAHELVNFAAQRHIFIRKFSNTAVSVAFDETTTEAEFAALLEVLGLREAGEWELSPLFNRSSAALNHPVFNVYHSETEMMRYLRRLSDKDLALDRTMIPLGSCTMKLNAATEMAAITWPEFANVHPYAPEFSQAGWLGIIEELEKYLAEATGYDAVSLQPNAGSQGEFAGLLAISAYHASRGESHRNICLIPSSAHGTNAASAVMAGMNVVVVGCDELGNVDLADLSQKIEKHAANLAAIMVTYPSTHGVYEEGITELCAKVHDAGGQVYVDGANLNALVGLAKPGKFGADVSHLNLHKTFCIPHGGGGPGVGPVAVRSHLAPFLPSDPNADVEAGKVGAVSSAKHGSVGILPIPYAYIRMMGPEGLKKATELAVLSANYIAKKLADHYPVLYTNHNGRVAHECIIDLREITKTSGVSVDDVAKRLIDFGFHAPTMSFPVAGTLMIEPTESESLAEVDRFINAMIAIKGEIDAVQRGEVAYDASALKNAPHTAEALLQHENANYRLATAYPAGVVKTSKYWPPVGRIDGAFGDRNLTCTCPAIEDLAADL